MNTVCGYSTVYTDKILTQGTASVLWTCLTNQASLTSITTLQRSKQAITVDHLCPHVLVTCTVSGSDNYQALRYQKPDELYTY